MNPAAGRGRGAKLLDQVRSAFAAHGVTDVFVTAGASDEQRLASEAIACGFSTIVCVGGDGTSGNIANVILQTGSNTRLGVVPAGRGNDFPRTLGVERATPAYVAQRAARPSKARIDVGRIEKNFFLNSCGFGFDVAVVQGLARARWIGNRTVYFYSALQQILGFRGLHMRIQSPKVSRDPALHLLVVLANGSRFGGGLAIAPTATVTDGMLDAVMIRDATRTRRLRMLAAATRGTHDRFGEVIVERATQFTLNFSDAPFYEIDGELHQARSSELLVECVPRALRVIAGDSFEASADDKSPSRSAS